MGLRVDDETEAMGIDEAEHAETAYDFATLGTLGRATAVTHTSKHAPAAAPVGREG